MKKKAPVSEPKEKKGENPMRINRYLAKAGYATRKEADTLIEKGRVFVNGRKAVLGEKIRQTDKVEVKSAGKPKTFQYVAYYKPRGVSTHASTEKEVDIKKSTALLRDLSNLFPIGRLDKESEGLMILTNDGRITDRLLNPDKEHDKEYLVRVQERLRDSFKEHMEKGVDVGEYVSKPCTVKVLGSHTFLITLTEGKKHQIRRMAEALHLTINNLKRVRILNIRLTGLSPGDFRPIEGPELKTFLSTLGL